MKPRRHVAGLFRTGGAFALLALACVLLPACSRMSVRVSMLDRNFLASPEAAESLVNHRVPRMSAWAVDQSAIDKALAPLAAPLQHALATHDQLIASMLALNTSTATSSEATRAEIEARIRADATRHLQSIDAARREGLLLSLHARGLPARTSDDILTRQQAFHAAWARFNHVDAAMAALDPALLNLAATAAREELHARLRSADEATRTQLAQIESSLASAPDASTRDLLIAQRDMCNRRIAMIASQSDAVSSLAADLRRTLPPAVKAATNALTAETGYVPAAMSIIDDPNASMVVYAPDRFWRGEYNRAFAAGDGGNTDIAIVMQGPGSFSVKGLRNDTSKITAATFSVLKSSLVVAASAAGAPIPDLKPTTAEGKVQDGMLDERLTGIASAGDAEARARAQVRDVRKEFASLAEIITSQQAQLASDPAPALANIKAAFTSAKKRLNPPAPAN